MTRSTRSVGRVSRAELGEAGEGLQGRASDLAARHGLLASEVLRACGGAMQTQYSEAPAACYHVRRVGQLDLLLFSTTSHLAALFSHTYN